MNFITWPDDKEICPGVQKVSKEMTSILKRTKYGNKDVRNRNRYICKEQIEMKNIK